MNLSGEPKRHSLPAAWHIPFVSVGCANRTWYPADASIAWRQAGAGKARVLYRLLQLHLQWEPQAWAWLMAHAQN